MTCNRREFLLAASSSAALAAAGAAGGEGVPAASQPQSSPAAGDAQPIIDTHQHLWDLSKLRLPWLKGVLNRSFLVKDYLEAAEGLGIVQAVYMEVDVAPEQKADEARLVLDLARRREGPTRAAVIGGRLESPDFRKYLAVFQDDPNLKGVRQIVPSPKGRPELYADAQFIANVRWLGELGLRFDLCPPATGLGDALALAEKCPDTRFVLDHCGNADFWAFFAGRAAATPQPAHDADAWRRDIARLAERKNVVCKISGIIARSTPGPWRTPTLARIVTHCLDAFGPAGVMFGSDWPVCTLGAPLRQWVETLREIVKDRSGEHQRKLFHDNAHAFYGLK